MIFDIGIMLTMQQEKKNKLIWSLYEVALLDLLLHFCSFRRINE